MGIKIGTKFLALLLLLLATISVAAIGQAAAASNISIMQISSNLPDLTLYLRLSNVALEDSKLKENLDVTVNGIPAQINDISAVKDGKEATEGDAYTILVDTSKSMKNRAGQLKILLEKILDSTGENDRVAVLGFSNQVNTIKDYNLPINTQNIIREVNNAVAAEDGGNGTYLYNGILDAVKLSRSTLDIPDRRIVVVISDGDVDGDSFNLDDISKSVDIDRIPVYGLILNEKSRVNGDSAVDKIANKTGGECFIKTSGKELFNALQSSLAQCRIVKLRCDNIQPNNDIAVIKVLLKSGNIQQSAKFTASRILSNTAQVTGQNEAAGNGDIKKSLRWPIFIAISSLIVIFVLVALWLLRKRKMAQLSTKGGNFPHLNASQINMPSMPVLDSQVASNKISLQFLQGSEKGKIVELETTKNHLIGSSPVCTVHSDVGNRIFGSISAIDSLIIISSQSPGEIFFNGMTLQGSHILENGDLIRVPGVIFRVIK